MPTRDLSNKRITVALGLASAILDLSAPLASEANLMLNATPAIRWNGYDFNGQASTKVDDRSLDDEGAAQVRGYDQFGGAVPFFYPKVTDTASILRQVYNLVKQSRTQLALIQRVGWVSSRTPFAAGDNVNAYLVETDSLKPDTAGDGGYAFIEQFLARARRTRGRSSPRTPRWRSPSPAAPPRRSPSAARGSRCAGRPTSATT
jgi:hypothetical protein